MRKILPGQAKRKLILLEVGLLALTCVGLKLLLAYLGLEIPYSPILSALLSSSIFLFGFMLSGVLADYKEAEKIPDEIAVSIQSIVDQCYTTYLRTKDKTSLEYIRVMLDFVDLLFKWFRKEVRTRVLMKSMGKFSKQIVKIEQLTQPTFIARLKNENSIIRRQILRVYSIRETEFLGASHIIFWILLIFVLLTLLLTQYNSVFESVFYVFGFSAVYIFIFKLIYDLDNPFDYYSSLTKYKDSVSLDSLIHLKKRVINQLRELEKL